MSSVTFHTAVGGDGSTVTDDSSQRLDWMPAAPSTLRARQAVQALLLVGITAQLDQLFIAASKL